MKECFILGPAPSGVTDAIYQLTQSISEYRTCLDLKADIGTIGTQQFTVDGRPFTVQVVDSVQDYMELMSEIFDFAAIKSLLAGGFRVTCNALYGGRHTSNTASNSRLLGLFYIFILKPLFPSTCLSAFIKVQNNTTFGVSKTEFSILKAFKNLLCGFERTGKGLEICFANYVRTLDPYFVS